MKALASLGLSLQILFAFGLSAVALGAASKPPAKASRVPQTEIARRDKAAKVVAHFRSAPLRFELNQGQTAPEVRFLSRGRHHTLFLLDGEAVLTTDGAANTRVFRMRFVGANPQAQIAGAERLKGKTNYLFGNNPRLWHTGIPNYAQVRYNQLYPGVDLVYHGRQGQLEFDFVVAPQVDPSVVRLAFDPADHVHIDASGNLRVKAGPREVQFHKPRLYQEGDGGRELVAGGYVMQGRGLVGFEVGPYDPARQLVIDPTLGFSTYLGGDRADSPRGIALDAAGNVYLAGYTRSSDFPTAPPVTPPSGAGGADIFVTKLDANGTGLIYSTYLGGGGDDSAEAIAVDGLNNAYVSGQTLSLNFPITAGSAYQATCASCSAATPAPDAFLLKLDDTGSGLDYSTYLGGSGAEDAAGIAVDSTGKIWVTGITASANFPKSGSAIRSTFAGANEAFAAKFDPTLLQSASLLYSTYLGGSTSDEGRAIAVDSSDNVYIAGATTSSDFQPTPDGFQTVNATKTDAYVVKLTSAGTAAYSTYLGGSTSGEKAVGIGVDSGGQAYVVGFTDSTDFPTQDAQQPNSGGGTDAFVTKLSANGKSLLYSTYLGGSQQEKGRAVAVDTLGNAYVSGFTLSVTDFPIVSTPLQPTFPGGRDAFIAKYNPSGVLVYSSNLGGSANEEDDDGAFVAVNASGEAYLTGDTKSADFPTELPYQAACASCATGNSDVFLAQVVSIALPVARVTPSSVSFSAQGVGTTSAAQTVKVENRGDKQLTITAIGLSGTNSADFLLNPASNCPISPSTLAAGTSCTVSVKFSPLTNPPPTTRTALLNITDDDGGSPGSVQSVALDGDAVTGAFIAVDTTSLNFGDQPVGKTSSTQIITLSNPGNATLSITSISVTGTNSGDFTQTNGCGTSVPVAGSCAINVTFTPSAPGPRTAAVTITGSATNSPRNVNLSGNGVPADFTMSVSPVSATVRAGTKATFNVTFTPVAGFDQTINLGCAGSPPAGSCSTPSNSIALDGTNPTVVGFTINTTARSMVPPLPHGGPPSPIPWWLWAGIVSLAALGAVALRSCGRRASLVFGSVVLLVVLWASCGGGSNGDGGGNPGTPPGTYTITITGTSGSLSHNITATLEVN